MKQKQKPKKLAYMATATIAIVAVATMIYFASLQNSNAIEPTPKLVSSDDPVTNFDGIVMDVSTFTSAIKSKGLQISQKEEIPDSFFSVPIKVFSVGGIDLQIYEFSTDESYENAKLMISDDGTEIGTSMVHWMDSPHFYGQGKIIVQYVGHNPEMINILDSMLGNQFAGM